MEDLAFNVFLFILIYSFLCCLYTGSRQRNDLARHETTQNNSEANIKPIEKQLKEIWKEIDRPIDTAEEEIEELPLTEELLKGIELNDITAIAARKIASRLQIQQTVNKKKRSKASLIKDIEKKLKLDPVKIAPIIIQNVAAIA